MRNETERHTDNEHDARRHDAAAKALYAAADLLSASDVLAEHDISCWEQAGQEATEFAEQACEKSREANDATEWQDDEASEEVAFATGECDSFWDTQDRECLRAAARHHEAAAKAIRARS